MRLKSKEDGRNPTWYNFANKLVLTLSNREPPVSHAKLQTPHATSIYGPRILCHVPEQHEEAKRVSCKWITQFYHVWVLLPLLCLTYNENNASNWIWTDFRIAESLLFAETNLLKQSCSAHCFRFYRLYQVVWHWYQTHYFELSKPGLCQV